MMPSEHLVYTNVCVYIHCMCTVMMPSEHLVYTNVCVYILYVHSHDAQ